MAFRPNIITKKDTISNPQLKEDNYYSKIIKYIPAEVVAVYVSLRGFVMKDDELMNNTSTLTDFDKPNYFAIIFFGALIITPIYTFFASRDNNKPKPIFHTIVATISFVFWVFALGDYFKKFEWHDFTLASIFLVFVTLIIPLLERIFLKPLQYKVRKNISKPKGEFNLNIRDELINQINSNKIKFDNDNQALLRDQLLGDNSGAIISVKLQKLILFLSKEVSTHVRISSIVRSNTGTSHHSKRRAFDIGNEEIASQVLPLIANDFNVGLYDIDEIIFDYGPPSRNAYNYNDGMNFEYSNSVLNKHQNHIHISVKE